MPTDTMNPVTAVTWGPFIAAAAQQYTSDPSQLNPATITNMPAGFTLVRTIQMSDFFGPQYGSRTWRCELGEGPGLADVILLRDVRV